MIYSTSDIARIGNIHTNTVRFYERIGLISPVSRAENGYRTFDYKHLYQVKILRCMFLDVWPGKNIRNASNKIVSSMKSWDLESAKSHTDEYIKVIQDEYDKAIIGNNILNNWLNKHRNIDILEQNYSRAEAAKLIGTTPEALRNWERNELIVIPRKGNNKKRLYGTKEIERLQVIYMLRQCNYSMSAINRCFRKIDIGDSEEAVSDLINPSGDTFIFDGDNLINILRLTKLKADEVVQILAEINEEKL